MTGRRPSQPDDALTWIVGFAMAFGSGTTVVTASVFDLTTAAWVFIGFVMVGVMGLRR